MRLASAAIFDVHIFNAASISCKSCVICITDGGLSMTDTVLEVRV